MFDEGFLLGLVDDLDEVDKSSSPDDGVSVEDAVTADISDGPYGLLDDAGVVGFEEFDEEGDASLIDDALALDGGSGGDIGESPGSLELQLGVFLLFDVLDHAGDETCVDDCLDGRAVGDREDLPHSDHGEVLPEDIGLCEGGNQLWEDIHGVGLPEEAA